MLVIVLIVFVFVFFNSSLASFFYSFGAKAKPQVYIYKYINKFRAIDKSKRALETATKTSSLGHLSFPYWLISFSHSFHFVHFLRKTTNSPVGFARTKIHILPVIVYLISRNNDHTF
jgi:hypothetical protein